MKNIFITRDVSLIILLLVDCKIAGLCALSTVALSILIVLICKLTMQIKSMESIDVTITRISCLLSM